MSNETKRNLEIATLVLSLILACFAVAKSWALTPYRIDELAAAQSSASQRIEVMQREQNATSNNVLVQLATITEGQRAFRRDIDEIKADVKEIKAKR